MRRPAADFREYRQYAPGDDIRYVDWKASARQEHIFIKQGEHQKAATVYVLLDCSASMAWGDPPKSQTALALANALSYLALAHDDRLVILPITQDQTKTVPPLGPLWGKGQVPVLSGYFQAVRFQGQIDLTQTLVELSYRKYSSGGLVLVISDLLGVKDLTTGLDALPQPSWKVVCFQLLHPAEINPTLNGYFEMQDIETGQKKLYPVTPKALETYRQRLESLQKQIAQDCLERNAVYTLFPTNWSIENEILSQLRRTQVVKPL